jgi:uncharacterized protein (DUF305 family)
MFIIAKTLEIVNTLKFRPIIAGLLLSPLSTGCSREKPAEKTAAKPADTAVAAGQGAMNGMSMGAMSAPVTIPKNAIYTVADVRFMQGMIAHHAQAIYMSRMAASRQANPRVLKFANKIDQSQQAEIRLMQEWLRVHQQAVPDTSSWRTTTMPGMLTPQQLKDLDASKGTDFDSEFLTLMIQHHEGALKMVADLLATPLAAQDVDVSVFANDVVSVQTAEIQTMQQMLGNL